ncbi:hypothetical protein ColLi_12215 [Colletotrichum liriopes]|uniref:Uncharacterized protein n=1 Tax=Colletotrichum liriopes TaxID=708192 RepID=A0AA37GYJ5_9PEZI|nr:hypothetical protein ColLi_12215 [Colletotrichum liriopes]
MKAFRSATSLWGTAKRAFTGGDLTSRRSAMNFSTTKEANGAPQGNNGPNESSSSPLYMSIVRVMEAGRGHTIDKGTPAARRGAYVTRNTGDFNHEPYKAAYAATTENGAFYYTKHINTEHTDGVSMAKIQVPHTDLIGAKEYKMDTQNNIDMFRMRLIADRQGWNLDQTSKEFGLNAADQIGENRTADITIGPESGVATGLYIEKGKFMTLEDMGLLRFTDGSYSKQIAFQGKALDMLAN